MDISALSLDTPDSRPRYRQLCEVLAAAIASGDLAAGSRLPSERDLAAQLGVSRTTAVNAYRELEARGLVRGHVGRGTFVSATPVSDDAPFAWRGKVALGAQRIVDPALHALVRDAGAEVVSFAPGVAALDHFPLDTFRTLSDAILRRDPAALALGPTEGQPGLRRVLAARSGVRPEQVLILAGAQQGLDLVARCLLDPGDTVVMDRPGYLGAIQPFRAAGARIVGWSIESGALDELEDAIVRYRPKFLYTNPTFQNPTGHTLPVGVRHELLELAARHRLPIVEDGTYQDLGFAGKPPPALRELDDQGLVISVNTFSKTLAPGLRLGWLIAPESIVDQLALIKARADVFSAGLMQLVVAEFLVGRRYDDHVRALNAEHARRHEVMLTALRREIAPGLLKVAPATGGLFLWGHLTGAIDARDLLDESLAAGVTFVPGEQFYPDGGGKYELRLCFSSAAPEQIVAGVRRLAPLFSATQAVRRDRISGRQPLV
ncbi:MAG TPA: PLP-dependent aminotransferase family protein [Thermomicrobiales bacterium]|jgi:DNA-binding transcriptional MocR family regulator